jgi:hypothetical protein
MEGLRQRPRADREGKMAKFKSEDKDLRSTAPVGTGSKAAALDALAARLQATGRRLNQPAVFVFGLIALFSLAAFVAGYFALRPAERMPVHAKPVVPAASPAASAWKPIAERVAQAQQGQFPMDEGILTFSKSMAAADAEIRSVVGTYALPDATAAQIENGESWGVTGVNRDELVMYVHNFAGVPLTAMTLRISEGSCASFGSQSPTRWVSAYWGNPLGGGKEAVIHATLPEPFTLTSYCAVVVRVYSSRVP